LISTSSTLVRIKAATQLFEDHHGGFFSLPDEVKPDLLAKISTDKGFKTFLVKVKLDQFVQDSLLLIPHAYNGRFYARYSEAVPAEKPPAHLVRNSRTKKKRF
jgi:hypothetical protein